MASRSTLLLPLLTLLTVLGCSFDATPLTERQCADERDCAAFPGFICQTGYCVLDTKPKPDASPDVEDVAEEVSGCNDIDGDGAYGKRNCDTGTDCDDGNPEMYPGNTEICDGLDNDCDGTPDNLIEPCELTQGVCEGTLHTCVDGQAVCDYGENYVVAEEYCTTGIDLQSMCEGDQTNYDLATGGAVLCDGLDNDCDGDVDEGSDAIPCYANDRAELSVPARSCRAGKLSCDDGFANCDGEVLPVETEDTDELRCDGFDNDCDGTVDGHGDDDFCACSGTGERPCYTGTAGTEDVGQCVGGTQTCEGGAWPELCDGETVPEAETCANMGEDNDCDTFLDDIDGHLAGDICTVPNRDGVCATGTWGCDTNDALGVFGCQQTVFPGPETCQDIGTDNDCDGNPNEVQAGANDSTTVVMNSACTADAHGICADNGKLKCPGGGAYPVCEPGLPETDVPCDGINQDCSSDDLDAVETGTVTNCSGCNDACTGATPLCCAIGGGAYDCRDSCD